MKSHASLSRPTLAAAIAVGAIAVALRMPSCYESFWVDELHSAWTVWESLADVAPRAGAGHQSPFYFYGLWFWKQFAGVSELGLRMSSVIATAIGSVVLTIGVANWTRCLAAGITAGMVLAIERNAIFFGTELRPYAWVLLLASIAVICFLVLTKTKSRFERPRIWSTLLASVLLAALCQPTSVGVLAWFPLTLLGFWSIRDRREWIRLGIMDVLWSLAAAAALFFLWRFTVGESWAGRSQWAAFASATDLRQLTRIWDWTWLLVVPLGVTFASALLIRQSTTRSLPRGWLPTIVVLSVMAIALTALYWWVAWLHWAPLWHRRYFVAVLPIFAAIAGIAVAVADHAAPVAGRIRLPTMLTASLLILSLAFQQRTLPQVTRYPVALAVRGEDWRGAVRWINEASQEGDRIFLDPGLIESRLLGTTTPDPRTPVTEEDDEMTPMTDRSAPSLNDYLRYPVRGPYQVEGPVTLCNFEKYRLLPSAGELTSGTLEVGNRNAQAGRRTLEAGGVPSQAGGRDLILVRQSRHRLAPRLKPPQGIVPFGGVSVVILPRSMDERLPDSGNAPSRDQDER